MSGDTGVWRRAASRFLSQRRPERKRGLTENPALVFLRQEREFLPGQVELVLEAPIANGGEERAPHQAPGPDPINKASEEHGQVEMVLETPTVSGGENRAPHQALGPEDINELGEELLGFALSSSRRVQVYARKLQVEIREPSQFEQWLDALEGRASAEERHRHMIQRDGDVREAFERIAHARDL